MAISHCSWIAKFSCASIVLLCAVPMLVSAGKQADDAVKHVQALIAAGEIREGTVLNLVAKQGNIANFLGDNHSLKERWESATGTLLDAYTMPQKASLAFIQQAEDVDLTIARNREFADLYHQGLITDLSPYSKRFGFQLENDTDLLLPDMQAVFADKQVAIPADGDLAILYLRKDFIENPANQAAYERKFGEPLSIPETWQEYQQQVEFFHRPEEGIYGSLEQRDKASGWMFWMLRYASQRTPLQPLFDADMNPMVNSEQGIAATNSYLATVPFSPEGILNSKSNYTFTLPKFLNGQGYSTIITLAGAKIFNLPHSKVKDKYAAVPMPGNRIDGSINRKTTLIYGNNLVIPKSSGNKTLAYLFSMWLTDPDISMEALSVSGGFSDPYRYSHLSSEQMVQVYSMDVLDVVKAGIDDTVPAGTGLPGDTEYIATLNEHLHKAAKGLKTAEQAMQDVEHDWQAITEKYGREKQKQLWSKVRMSYPNWVAE